MQIYQFSFYSTFVKSKEHQHKTMSLSTFLESVRQGKYSKIVGEIRTAAAKDQEVLKLKLPYCTVSGIFEPGKRNAKSLMQHSGLIQIDIDEKEQLKFDVQSAKRMIAGDRYLLAVFLSPRGRGLKGIVKIDPQRHRDSFLALEKYFKENYQLHIDAACKDVCRPFFVSHDADLVYNPDSEVFPLEIKTENSVSRPALPAAKTEVKREKDIEALCSRLEQSQIDITNRNGYGGWRDIGFAIANGLGETGRDFFKRISKLGHNYDESIADKQYTACCKNPDGSRKWESLFGIAKDFGITINGKDEIELPNNKNLPLIVQVENFLKKRFEFRRNVINEKIEYKSTENNGEWNEANENDISRLLEHNYFKFSPTKTASLLNSDFVKSYNPIKDYFDSLKYLPGEEPSYIDQLCSKIKAKEQERFNKHFKKMLIRCIACSTVAEMSNNNFNKHVFVFINRQQTIGKSSFCRWLCPPELKQYFVENIAMDKDGLIALATSFLINLDELAGLSKYDINQLKAKISMASINERLPYGHRRQFYPRRANFIGSTNTDEFLNDDTGNARWLCFEIENFEHGFWEPGSHNYIDIQKIWAEAKYLFDSGYKFQLTSEEKVENDEINRGYEERTIEEEMISGCFEIDFIKIEENFMTATDILQYLVLNKSVNPNKISLKKIGSVVKKLGFLPGEKRREKSFPVKGYFMRKV